MTAERWALLRDVLESAEELDDHAREALIRERLTTDELRLEARQLLAFEHRASDLFRIDAWQHSLALQAGQRVGAFAIGGELGHGGMGRVYLAQRVDGAYEQTVAIKVVHENVTDRLADRFLRERQLLASLTHPGIARLLDGGVLANGRPWLALEYIAGRPVDAWCEEKQLGSRARVELFLKIADAIQSAHQQLVLHLDIKPANILVSADGEPHLLDFGIARVLSEVSSADQVTARTIPVFTPRFASPEQMRGETVGVASDIFSSATLLYLLLTGKLPYPIADLPLVSAVEVLRAHSPDPPTALVPALRGLFGRDIDNVVLSALRAEAADRYPTMAAFADDLRRMLASLPIRARRSDSWYRLRRFTKRHRATVLATGVAVLLAVVGAIAIVLSNITAHRQRALAEQRLKDVRQLARSYMFELDPLLEQVPGTVEVRHRILSNTQDYLAAISGGATGDEDLVRETAQGYNRVGLVLSTSGMPSVGDLHAAEQAMTRGIALQRNLVNAHPQNMYDRTLLMQQMRHLADVETSEGDLEKARHELEQAWQTGQPLVGVGPTSRRYIDLATIAQSLAELNVSQGDAWSLLDPAAAKSWIEQAGQITNATVQLRPAEANSAVMHEHLELQEVDRGELSLAEGQPAQAAAYLDHALQLATTGEQNVYQQQNARAFRMLLAECLLGISDDVRLRDLRDDLVQDAQQSSSDAASRMTQASTTLLVARIDAHLHAAGYSRLRLSERIADVMNAEQRIVDRSPADASLSATFAWDSLRAGSSIALPPANRLRHLQRALQVAAMYRRAHPEALSALLLTGQAQVALAELAGQTGLRSESDMHAHEALQTANSLIAARPGLRLASALRTKAQSLVQQGAAVQRVPSPSRFGLKTNHG